MGHEGDLGDAGTDPYLALGDTGKGEHRPEGSQCPNQYPPRCAHDVSKV
jgi:hypothetical protein